MFNHTVFPIRNTGGGEREYALRMYPCRMMEAVLRSGIIRESPGIG